MSITLQTQVQVNSDITAQIMDNEIVMANLQRGKYYGLGATGKRIWELVQQPRKVSDLCTHLLVEYDVDPSTCEIEVLTFLNRLQQEGLIQSVEQDS